MAKSIQEQIDAEGSELERAFDTQLAAIAPDLPPPTQQFVFASGRNFRFDRAWPTHLVAIELEGMHNTKARFIKCHNCGCIVRAVRGDGKPGKKIPHVGYHQRAGRFKSDAEKYNLAVERGWYVLRFVHGDVYDDPFKMVETIRCVLARRDYRITRGELLTDREKGVLTLIAAGFTNRAIGRRLYLEEATIKSHLNKTFVKLGARTRSEAVAKALNWGMILFDDLKFYEPFVLPEGD